MPRKRTDTPEPQIPFRQVSFAPSGWSTDIPVACDEEGNVYWPVRALSVWLGIDPAGAIRKLRHHRKIGPNMRFYFLRRGGGEQPTWTILERDIARWFIAIDDPRIRSEIAERLEQFQDEIVDTAYERLFGSSRRLPAMDASQLTDVVRRQNTDVNTLKFAYHMLEQRLGRVEEQLSLPPAPDMGDDDEDLT